MSATEELERGRLAQDVLENPVYVESMAQLQQEILTKWQGEKGQQEREWLWSLMQAAKRLDKILADTMNTGILRQRQIEQERSRLERLGSVFKGR